MTEVPGERARRPDDGRLLVVAVLVGALGGYLWGRFGAGLELATETLPWWAAVYAHFLVYRGWLLAGAAGGLGFALTWRWLRRGSGS